MKLSEWYQMAYEYYAKAHAYYCIQLAAAIRPHDQALAGKLDRLASSIETVQEHLQEKVGANE